MSADGKGFSDLRRKKIKKVGKRLFRGSLMDFLSSQSKIPDTPVLDNALFPWAENLRAQWPVMRDELDALLERRAALPSFQEISPDQARISTDDQWKTFMLWGFGTRMDFGCELCPQTAAALEQVPGLSNAFFSILGPGKHIPRHRGVTKGLVRCHIGLRVPDSPERCLIQVDDVDCAWEEGGMFFFDDTYPHEVWNETDGYRAVLLFDIERPMGMPGKAVSRAMIAALRRTGYFRDALANQRAWEERYRAAMA
ncbi:aspartyl/asparaginyl beta-hydroxylase domain-containing protein [Salinisphaera sp. Q1T1-3]|uniref:aspartyl/asparaginyl beta-hydroxylase domain-containing protein n=1 Tax=Salinisphaera sp. Q1T1-3 TaxID=2321229 RepID=UPI000E7438D4|nr:aspartyl/asparaginyl beta-hydroxylase domain-containing protein [Salinisphaera sp. Q1T1-3]RJS92211.1 aspartyl/asparaginyl beta-hydroxylase domain-containing protein [Salinisphaera sp. Q1T1-3]